MTNDERKLWSLYRSGQMPFRIFQEKYQELTGEAVPDSVGRITVCVGPITKQRHEYLRRMVNQTTTWIKEFETDNPLNKSPSTADSEPRA